MMTAQLHGQGIGQALKDVISKDSTNEAEEKGKTVLRNRAHESRSPYVQSHGSNPVAWQLWGDDAIELARKENKCLFVSIGYSACHWCHVMERESFENDEVAAILNEAFIPVKIDREERPDIDRIYMNFVQATTGSGGWPLNVFVTPELHPIFGGTYWPGPTSSTQSIDQVDFLGILNKLSTVWKEQEMRCRQESSQILQQLKNFAAEGTFGDQLGEGSDALDLEILEEANQHFASTFDKTNGGFGSAPKFPTPSKLSFLLRIGQYPQAVLDVVGAKECRDSENMAITTLRKMARGGIHDHIGSGFARYSVTDDWSLPHFEKMLYDNAQLLDIYLDGFLLCRDAELLGVVYDLANYLTTTLAHPEGGFYSSEDADSFYRKGDPEKREGAFYVWTKREFENILGEKAHPILSAFFNVRSHGNVLPENDAHDEFIDQNVLAIVSSPVALAAQFGLKEDEVVKIIKEGKQKLKEHREKERVRPALDDKIVVGWNGIALGALARTVTDIRQFDPERAKTYMDSAVKAANFIKEKLYDSDKRLLWRVYREGRGDANAFADDYAFLIEGLIDLYEATFEEKWLQWADELQQSQILQFYDDTTGAFFSTASSAPHTILRLKDGMDSAEPSTNGVSASNLYRLGGLLNDTTYTKKAKETVGGFESELLQYPWLFSSFMPSIVAGAPGNTGVKSVVVSGSSETPIVKKKIEEYAAAPRGTLATLAKVDSESKWLRERNSQLKDFALDGKARILICDNGICREETDEELEQIRDITNSGATLSIAAEETPVSLDAKKVEEKDTTATEEAKPVETPSIMAEGIENTKALPTTEGAL